MSGRDFKTFLASHQHQIGQQDGRLVTRFLSGQKPSYKPIDYAQVAAYSKIKNSSATKSLRKIEKLQEVRKQNKNVQLLQEHRRIWEKEIRRLKASEEKLENEILALQPSSQNFKLPTTATEELYEDIFDLQDSLRLEMKAFVKSTLNPIHELRDDIQGWMRANKPKLVLGYHERENEKAIAEIINSVKKQQASIMSQLEEEQKIREDSLREHVEPDFGRESEVSTHRSVSTASSIFDTNSYTSTTSTKLPKIVVGVPHKVLQLECPDEGLSESCYEEFHSLDEKYVNAIECLEEKYKNVIDRQPCNGWKIEDCIHFAHIMEQYSGVSKNRRKLYIDRLRRELLQKSLADIKDFENFWFRSKSLQTQLKSLFHAWKRDREDLTWTVIGMFHDAQTQYETYQQNVVEHMKQKFVCNYLHEKLLKYHTECLELMTLETQHQALREQEEEKKRNAKQTKEIERRCQDKEKIAVHKEQQERENARRQELNRLRMLELQKKRAQQRLYDAERVHYRKEVFDQKTQLKQLEKLCEEELHLEKERRLQRVTKQINSTLEHIPSRLLEPTKTFLARTATIDEEEKEIQEPLFNVYTYTVDQVAQDKRLKIENALRRANLHMTDYGRSILNAAPPPTKPRRGMESTVFK